ncbi:hypothetical protein [Actinomadura fibrosa]|uniref:Uncharacterized protein n=1 Tax=Actinomadura fibrosa TaxID=111802 RepID=A0ABW2XZI0_9ACTN|nr:hypothetical protein [Actinomadura fibrosa]
MSETDARTDHDTELLAGELHERVRALNSLTRGGRGLTQPSAAYTILGNLAQTAFCLAQTAEQIDAFLDRELTAGRIVHDQGINPVPAVLRAHDALVRSAEQMQEAGDSLRRAQGALTTIHAHEVDEVQSLRQRPSAAPLHQADHAASEVNPAGAGFPAPIGDMLPEASQSIVEQQERRPTPQPPPNRREL